MPAFFVVVKKPFTVIVRLPQLFSAVYQANVDPYAVQLVQHLDRDLVPLLLSRDDIDLPFRAVVKG